MLIISKIFRYFLSIVIEGCITMNKFTPQVKNNKKDVINMSNSSNKIFDAYMENYFKLMQLCAETTMWPWAETVRQSLTETTKQSLTEAAKQSQTDAVRQFWMETEKLYVWDLLPSGFLYDLYRSWSKINTPNTPILGRNKFVEEIRNVIKDNPIWRYDNKTIRSRNRMDGPEPLIVKYNLSNWKNDTYTGSDPNMIATPNLKEYYRGVVRLKGRLDTSHTSTSFELTITTKVERK